MVSVKAFIDNNLNHNAILLRQFNTEFPYVYRNKYLANSRILSPRRTGRLIRSIGTQILGNTLTIVWRAPYALAVDQGGHKDKTTHFAPAKGFGDGGRGYRTRPGWFHPYKTGSKGFANRIGVRTHRDMQKYIAGKLG
jgi:hypothetical protein